ncbi:hypothetical protein SDC9_121793 [bioreactor metagenome]|uniref:Uncharacterized protein n=1 Tax=bioreactor metagenome TaxID=1076179 RepID=A0A645CD00_9ZZZZ
MKKELQQKLFDAGPVLYGARAKACRGVSAWTFQCPDSLFDILFRLTENIEKYNQRFPRRRVRALIVKMEAGKMIFQTQRTSPLIERLIASARYEVKLLRAEQKRILLNRAKKIQTTALFDSMLLPDWKRLMADDYNTGRRILEYAEKVAFSNEDWELLSLWYRRYLHDDEAAQCCFEKSKND